MAKEGNVLMFYAQDSDSLCNVHNVMWSVWCELSQVKECCRERAWKLRQSAPLSTHIAVFSSCVSRRNPKCTMTNQISNVSRYCKFQLLSFWSFPYFLWDNFCWLLICFGCFFRAVLELHWLLDSLSNKIWFWYLKNLVKLSAQPVHLTDYQESLYGILYPSKHTAEPEA